MRRPPIAVLAAVLAVVGACSGADDQGAGPTTSAEGATENSAPTSDAPSATEGPVDTDPVVATDADSPSTTAPRATTTVIDTVPDTGVPGIDSADVFCRSWSEFAGSFQALALASAFNPGEERPVVLELAASPVLLAAVAGLDGTLPAELESERDALVDELVGPMARRAERARATLSDAGLDDAQIEQLGTAWLDALSTAGVDDPEIAIVVPDEVDVDALGSAVDDFSAAIPAINQDPSLITDASTPATEQYLSQNCPDQGTLAGNDVVDQF